MAETDFLECLLVLLLVIVLAFCYLALLKTARPLESNLLSGDSSPEGRKKAYFAAMSMVIVPGFLIMTSTDILEWLKDVPRSGAMLLVLSISMVWGAVCLVMIFLVGHGRRIEEQEIVGDGPPLNASPSIDNIAGSGADTSADPAMLA